MRCPVAKSRRACGIARAEPVQLRWQPAIPADELRTMIGLAGALPGIGVVWRVGRVTELYRQRGFVSATAKYSVVETDPGRREGLIKPVIVISGPPHPAGIVQITGNSRP